MKRIITISVTTAGLIFSLAGAQAMEDKDGKMKMHHKMHHHHMMHHKMMHHKMHHRHHHHKMMKKMEDKK